MRVPFLFLMVIGLAGCVRFTPHPLSPVQTSAQLEARRLDDAALKIFLEQSIGHEVSAWPLSSWDLKSLTLAGFYFNPTLAVARAQWQTTEAGKKTAGGRLNPTVVLTPGYDSSAMPPVNPWIPFLNMDVPLQTAGKRRKKIAEASHLAEAARWNLVSAAWQIRAGIRTSLAEFIFAERRVEILKRQSDAQQETLRLLKQRVEVGSLAPTDVTATQLIFNRAEIDLADAKSALSQARAQLAQSVGLSLAALDGVKVVMDVTDVPTTELLSANARRFALCGRADIRSALASYAAAEDELRLQIAKQIPDVHFQPGYQFDQGDNKWSLGITFELPLVNQNQGPIAEAEARRAEAAARFIELQAKIIGQVELAVAAFNSRRENLAAFQRLVSEQKSRTISTEELVKAGASERLDVLGTAVESANADLAQLDAEAKFQQAVGALENAIQQPVEEDLHALFLPALISTPKGHP